MEKEARDICQPLGDDVGNLASNPERSRRNAESNQRLVTSSPTAIGNAFRLSADSERPASFVCFAGSDFGTQPAYVRPGTATG